MSKIGRNYSPCPFLLVAIIHTKSHNAYATQEEQIILSPSRVSSGKLVLSTSPHIEKGQIRRHPSATRREEPALGGYHSHLRWGDPVPPPQSTRSGGWGNMADVIIVSNFVFAKKYLPSQSFFARDSAENELVGENPPTAPRCCISTESPFT